MRASAAASSPRDWPRHSTSTTGRRAWRYWRARWCPGGPSEGGGGGWGAKGGGKGGGEGAGAGTGLYPRGNPPPGGGGRPEGGRVGWGCLAAPPRGGVVA